MRFKHITSVNILVTVFMLIQTSGSSKISNYLMKLAMGIETEDINELRESTVTKTSGRFLEGEEPTPTEEEEAEAKKDARVKDIRTTMIVLVGVIGILTAIGICCFIFSLNECNNKEPDSDAEEEEYGDEYGEEQAEGEGEGEGEGETDAIPTEVADDFVARLVMVGAKGVGKTLLWSRYTRGLIPKINVPTKSQSEDFFESKDVAIDDKEIKLLLWDTSGRPEQKNDICDLFKEKNGVIVMYDITKSETFETAKEWVKSAKSKMRENIAIMLIGNKNDCSEDKRQVSKEEAKEFAKDANIKFEEMSAFTGEMKKIHVTFENIVRFANVREN